MALGDFLARLGGAPAQQEAQGSEEPTPQAPDRDDLGAALDRVESMVAGNAVPGCVAARVERVTRVVRDTVPRLGQIRGSADAYSVMATATDYLPEALGGYLRLPRRFADTRPVDAGRTSLMVIVDQLDLLGATMDKVFDAVCRDDATALVAHGRFLEEKFGRSSTGGSLDVGTTYGVPATPPSAMDPAAASPSASRPAEASVTSVAHPPVAEAPARSVLDLDTPLAPPSSVTNPATTTLPASPPTGPTATAGSGGESTTDASEEGADPPQRLAPPSW